MPAPRTAVNADLEGTTVPRPHENQLGRVGWAQLDGRNAWAMAATLY